MSAARAEALAGTGLPLDPAEGAQAAQAQVYTGLRLVRTLAMLSIVAFHIDRRPLFGIAFGLISLQVVMCALATRRSCAPAPGPFAKKRAKRLLIPWVIWSVLYLSFELARTLRWGDSFATHLKPWMWASGGAYHLWFLPFAFVASLAVIGVQRLVQDGPKSASIALFAALGAALVLATAPLQSALTPIVPFDCWINSVPTLAFGLALGLTLARDNERDRQLGILVIALLSALPVLFEGTLPASAQIAERYAIGVPFVCLGLMVRVPKSRTLALFASVNMGVYLVHVFAIDALERLPDFLVLAALPPLVPIYLISILAVLCLRRLRIPYLV